MYSWLRLLQFLMHASAWNGQHPLSSFDASMPPAHWPVPPSTRHHRTAVPTHLTGQLYTLWRSSSLRRDGIVCIVDIEKDPADPRQPLCAVEAVTHIVEWTSDPDQPVIHRYASPERFVVALAELAPIGTSIADCS